MAAAMPAGPRSVAPPAASPGATGGGAAARLAAAAAAAGTLAADAAGTLAAAAANSPAALGGAAAGAAAAAAASAAAAAASSALACCRARAAKSIRSAVRGPPVGKSGSMYLHRVGRERMGHRQWLQRPDGCWHCAEAVASCDRMQQSTNRAGATTAKQQQCWLTAR